MFDGYSIICYHATRIPDSSSLWEHGLDNNWDFLQKCLTDFFISKGIDNDSIVLGIDAIRREYERKHSDSRQETICYTCNKSLFYDEYNVFFETIGGEMAAWALEDKGETPYTDLLNLLKENGTPVLVVFSIPFSDINICDKEKMIDAIVSSLLQKLQCHEPDSIRVEGNYHGNVKPNQIIDIIEWK